MNKLIKKSISGLLSAVMVIGLAPVTSFAYKFQPPETEPQHGKIIYQMTDANIANDINTGRMGQNRVASLAATVDDNKCISLSGSNQPQFYINMYEAESKGHNGTVLIEMDIRPEQTTHDMILSLQNNRKELEGNTAEEQLFVFAIAGSGKMYYNENGGTNTGTTYDPDNSVAYVQLRLY